MRNFLRLCLTLCFLYIWYQGFVFFLEWSLASNNNTVNDPALWFVLLLALYNLEHTNHK